MVISAPVGEGLNTVSVKPLLLQKGGYDVVRLLKQMDLITSRNNLGLLSQTLWKTEKRFRARQAFTLIDGRH